MKTHLFALTALFFLLTATSCQKKPNASFSSPKSEYNAGELVALSNTSDNAETFSWIVTGPDGNEMRSTERNYSFVASLAGKYEVRLGAYSKNGKYSNKSIQTIMVKSIEGSAVVYTTRAGSVSYYVSSSISPAGYVNSRSATGVPACGSTDCYTYTGKSGKYMFYATNLLSNATQTFAVNIIAGNCTAQVINF